MYEFTFRLSIYVRSQSVVVLLFVGNVSPEFKAPDPLGPEDLLHWPTAWKECRIEFKIDQLHGPLGTLAESNMPAVILE